MSQEQSPNSDETFSLEPSIEAQKSLLEDIKRDNSHILLQQGILDKVRSVYLSETIKNGQNLVAYTAPEAIDDTIKEHAKSGIQELERSIDPTEYSVNHQAAGDMTEFYSVAYGIRNILVGRTQLDSDGNLHFFPEDGFTDDDLMLVKNMANSLEERKAKGELPDLTSDLQYIYNPGKETSRGGFYYPAFKSAEHNLANSTNHEDVEIWQREGFEPQKEVQDTHGPVLEIGGPTMGGYHFLEGIKLPSKPLITNNTKDNVPKDMRDQVEQIVDGRNLPFGSESQGIILMKSLDIAESTPATINTPEFKDKFQRAELEMERLALGVLEFKDVKDSLRAQIYTEVWRTLKKDGLFFTDGTLKEVLALEKLGFELLAYRQEYVKPPKGISGFEGITYEVIMKKSRNHE